MFACVVLWFVKLTIEDILGVTKTVQEPHGFDSTPRSWLSLKQDYSGSQPAHRTSVPLSSPRRGVVASMFGDDVEDPDAVLFVACKECGVTVNSKLDECPACGRNGPGVTDVGLSLKFTQLKRKWTLASVDTAIEASGALSPRDSIRFSA